MVTAVIVVLAVILVVALTAVASAVRVLREYERGIVFRLGRLMEVRGPGLSCSSRRLTGWSASACAR